MSMLAAILQQTVRFRISPAASLAVADYYYPLSLAPAAFWAVVRADGGDIRVTTQDGTTECARQVCSFDKANKTGSLFVKANSGSAFYIGAGAGNPGPAASDPTGQHAVWGANTAGRWHMNESVSTAQDSTANGFSLTGTGANSYGVAAKIGLGASYGGGKHVSGSPVLSTLTKYSVSLWVYPRVVGTTTPNYMFSFGTASACEAIGTYGSKWIILSGGNYQQVGAPTVNNWYRVVLTRDGNTVRIWINGAELYDGPLAASLANGLMTLGCRGDGSWPFNGIVDEVRVYDNYVLTDDEITQDYAIQNDPAAFWTTGAAG